MELEEGLNLVDTLGGVVGTVQVTEVYYPSGRICGLN